MTAPQITSNFTPAETDLTAESTAYTPPETTSERRHTQATRAPRPGRIAALVGSRVCHDLISPLGAIGNGVELMGLTDGDRSSELDLISESVDNANARIRLFRIAYGTAANDQRVSRSEVLAILSAIARGGRFTYFWQIETDQPRVDVRAALLAVQCLEAAMPMGGDISVSLGDDGRWQLDASATRYNIDDALWSQMLTPSKPFDHTAAQVQFALLPTALRDAGRELSIDTGENTLSISF